MKTSELTKQEVRKRLVRFDEMIPCKTAFIDARTPGSDKKENFCLIGQGVAENPDQIVHVDIPHGFNVGAARQPKGCKNSHHSHDTEEVFMIHSGEWQFTWGENGQDGSITLSEGDTISLPANMFRGFENVGKDSGLMFSILGLNSSGSAGRVIWAPYVFQQAKNYGLVLLEDGRLIDTAAGVAIPQDGSIMPPTSQSDIEKIDQLTSEDMAKCIARQCDLDDFNKAGLSNIEGVSETTIIGISNDNEGFAAGKIAWPHGFHLRRLTIQAGAIIGRHYRDEEEVIIVQRGALDMSCDDDTFTLNKGDLFSTPISSIRTFRNSGKTPVDLWVIRRSDKPNAAQFI